MKNVYSVGQVNRYITMMFKQDLLLKHLYVKGEVSNCKYHASGHIYFTLKEEQASIACVMFAGSRGGLSFKLKDGQNVVVLGNVSVYERDGKYQLYASEIILEGAGLLYEKFEALKKELEEMGMFAPEYKQPIPTFAQKIGIVTSPTGAAIRDIQNIAARRNPYVQLILYPAQVQGELAAPSIIKGIETLDALGLDVLIVGRGGGSIEDLWAFNEESVARAIFACNTPVISAVGHEVDFTIADFVADLRAPTPSAAAELAVADIRQIFNRLQSDREMLSERMNRRLEEMKVCLEAAKHRMTLQNPKAQVREKRQFLMDREERIQMQMQNCLKNKRHQMMIYAEKLKGLSPLEKLSQGYSYTEDENGCPVASVQQVEEGDRLTITVSDGRIKTQVISCEAGKY